jgi:O-antigen/teichoic acid export membrane protein
MIVTPTAGAIEEVGKSKDMHRFLFQTTKFGIAFTLPALLMLVVFGDALVNVWMGQHYVNRNVIAILALGYILPISQDPVMRVLMGMNKHGKIAIKTFLISLSFYLVLMLYIYTTEWNLVNAALMVAVPLSLGLGVAMPVYACRLLSIKFLDYLKEVFLIPVLCSLPYILILFFIRWFMADHLLLAFIVALIVGPVVVLTLYWNFLLTERMKHNFLKMIGLA